MHKPMAPMISYYGGKQRIISKILPYVPKHTVYVEPFCGGATMLFKKPWPAVTNGHDYREVINDKSGDLINMYRMFQTRFDELEHLIMNTLYSESEYRKSIMILKREVEADDLWRAWAYYVNSQQSFSNAMFNAWGRGTFRKDSAKTWQSKLVKLNLYRDRMSSVAISSDDALKIIKQWDSPQTFFYCDPPYPGTNQGSYGGYTHEDFAKLIETIEGCKGSAIISCYKMEGIPESFKEFSIKAYSSSAGTTGSDRSLAAKKTEGRDRTEYLYIKKASTPRPEIQKLYDSGKYDCFEGDSIWDDETALFTA